MADLKALVSTCARHKVNIEDTVAAASNWRLSQFWCVHCAAWASFAGYATDTLFIIC